MAAAHGAGAETLEEPLTSGSLPLPATGVLYHYTTRASAQEMSIAGQLLPGMDGYIYLTDVLYTIGWQATDRLALPDKNAELVIALPLESLPRDGDGAPAIQYRGLVPPLPPPPGVRRTPRRGGAHQWVIAGSIP